MSNVSRLHEEWVLESCWKVWGGRKWGEISVQLLIKFFKHWHKNLQVFHCLLSFFRMSWMELNLWVKMQLWPAPTRTKPFVPTQRTHVTLLGQPTWPQRPFTGCWLQESQLLLFHRLCWRKIVQNLRLHLWIRKHQFVREPTVKLFV